MIRRPPSSTTTTTFLRFLLRPAAATSTLSHTPRLFLSSLLSRRHVSGLFLTTISLYLSSPSSSPSSPALCIGGGDERGAPSSTSSAAARRRATAARRNNTSGSGHDDDEHEENILSRALGPLGGEITFGAILGFTSGYALKKVGKVAAFCVGVTFITTQALSYLGYLPGGVNWKKIEKEVLLLLGLEGGFVGLCVCMCVVRRAGGCMYYSSCHPPYLLLHLLIYTHTHTQQRSSSYRK